MEEKVLAGSRGRNFAGCCFRKGGVIRRSCIASTEFCGTNNALPECTSESV